jgi:hypothetical protein
VSELGKLVARLVREGRCEGARSPAQVEPVEPGALAGAGKNVTRGIARGPQGGV